VRQLKFFAMGRVRFATELQKLRRSVIGRSDHGLGSRLTYLMPSRWLSHACQDLMDLMGQISITQLEEGLR
jgi:hypothetical protein